MSTTESKGELVPVTEAVDNGTKARTEPAVWQGNKPIKLKQEQIDKLAEPVDPDVVEIRPDDGMIYYSHVFVREKLNEVFGPLGWWMEEISTTVSGNWIYFKGRLVVAVGTNAWSSVAVGESRYQPTNSKVSWASAWEAAKSDAITRSCKDLGIGKECWQPRFAESWRNDRAIKVERHSKRDGRYFSWRRRDAKPFWDEVKRPEAPVGNRVNPHDEADHDEGGYDVPPPRKSSGENPTTSPSANTTGTKVDSGVKSVAKSQVTPLSPPLTGSEPKIDPLAWVDEYEKAIASAVTDADIQHAEFIARGAAAKTPQESLSTIFDRMKELKVKKQQKLDELATAPEEPNESQVQARRSIMDALVAEFGQERFLEAVHNAGLRGESDRWSLEKINEVSQALKSIPF